MRNRLSVLLVLLFSISLSFAQDEAKNLGPKTLEELQDSILNILIENNIPGTGIVMVSGNDIVFLKGIGKADVENNRDVNENTMFRLGSVSKLMVGLSILKLQEEGKLNLKDKISDLIPDIEITNQWEEEYPIRVENLLEYSAGFGDWSIAELASNDPQPKTLKESLEFYPKTSITKYAPGTRSQYSNFGVSLAAYIVETVSGMSYEDYVDKTFFKPMGMENMTFLHTKKYQQTGAQCYANGIKLPYHHILYRPSAALTGSPKELAYLLQFFINRGKVNSIQIISENSLQRMESSESIVIEHSQAFKSQGLTNYSSFYKGFEYRGHGGSVFGSNSDFRYLPEYNLGFAVMINGDDQEIRDDISRLIKQYQTKDLPQKTEEPRKVISYKSNQDLTGFYMDVNCKFEAIKFFKKIKSIKKIWHQGDTLYVKNVLQQHPEKYMANDKGEFVSVRSERQVIFQTNDPVAGQVIYGSIGMIKKISSTYTNFLLFIFWALLIAPISISLLALMRLMFFLIAKKKDKTALWICLWPFISIAIILSIALVLWMGLETKMDAYLILGNLSPISTYLFIATIAFALSSIWSIYYILKNRHTKMSRIFFYHSALAALINLIFTIYFFNNGIIGLMTWI